MALQSPHTPNKCRSAGLPPLSPLSPNTFTFENGESPPASPMTKAQKGETTDVDRNRNKFGSKHLMIRRQSSTDWEAPCVREDHKLAQVNNDEDTFQANIDLNCFPGFDLNEIDVDVYGYDVLVHARKENPNNPNFALSEISRQYRLPDDIDLESIKLRKNERERRVSVQADKLKNLGKPLSYKIVDVTNHNPLIKLI